MENITYLSKDDKSNIYTRIWPLNENINGIIVVIHGLGDHIDNYEEFASIMAKSGYIVSGLDLVGFGKTTDLSQFGYFENKEAVIDYYMEDINTYINKLKEEYNNIPIFILGFSYGSFVTRLYMNKYSNNINGAILIGSSYINPTYVALARFYTKILAVGKGWDDRNVFLYNKTIVSLNKRFEDKTIPSWLNSNTDFLLKHIKDPYISARLTLSGYYVLYDMINKCNRKKYIKDIRKDLPIYILSGKDDPVTSFGEDVYTIDKLYKKNYILNSKFKVYNGMRHDILNETNKDIVIFDLVTFLNNNK